MRNLIGLVPATILSVALTNGGCGEVISVPLIEGHTSIDQGHTNQTSHLDKRNSDTDSERASAPERVLGTYLVCVNKHTSEKEKNRQVSCRLEKDHKKYKLSATSNKPQWEGEHTSDEVSLSAELEPKNSPWHITYTYKSDNKISQEEILDSTISLEYFDLDLGRDVRLTKKVKQILRELRKTKGLRIYIDSIAKTNNEHTEDQPRLEIKVDEEWLELQNNPSNMGFMLGHHLATFIGMPGDFSLLAGIFGDSSYPYSTSNRSSTIETSFQTKSPYDVRSGYAVYIEVLFPGLKSIQGIRFKDRKKYALENLKSNMPDRFHLEMTPDGKSWRQLSDSTMTTQELFNVMEFSIFK